MQKYTYYRPKNTTWTINFRTNYKRQACLNLVTYLTKFYSCARLHNYIRHMRNIRSRAIRWPEYRGNWWYVIMFCSSVCETKKINVCIQWPESRKGNVYKRFKHAATFSFVKLFPVTYWQYKILTQIFTFKTEIQRKNYLEKPGIVQKFILKLINNS